MNRVKTKWALIIAGGLLGIALLSWRLPAMPPQAGQRSPQPTITWSAPQIEETLFPGTSTTQTVRFRSSEALSEIAVEVTPSLNNIVSVEPVLFPSILADRDYELMVTISAPTVPQVRSFGGELRLLNADNTSRTYAAPLTISLRVDNAASNPSIGTLTVTPTVIGVNTLSTVIVTAEITAPSLNPASVDLLRLNPTGPATELGQMRDDGTNGDKVPGDKLFTIQQVFNESATGAIQLQVSASFRGVRGRILSPVIYAIAGNPQGISLRDLSSDNRLVILGQILSVQSDFNPSGTDISTYILVSPHRLVKGSSLVGDIVIRIGGGTVGRISTGSGIPTFAIGEVVLLVTDGPDSSGQYTIPDKALGTFHVENHPTLGDIAVIDPAYKELETVRLRNPEFATLLIKSEQKLLQLSELIDAF